MTKLEELFQKGLIKTKVEVNKIVDLRFMQSALQTLGLITQCRRLGRQSMVRRTREPAK